MTYPTTPKQIADALQVIVDDLRAMPNDELPKIWVNLGIQPVRSGCEPQERMRAVDMLGFHLVGSTGVMDEVSELYANPFESSERQPGVSVRVYTNPLPDGTR